jgi:outer membrane lipoprotein-sorting protein
MTGDAAPRRLVLAGLAALALLPAAAAANNAPEIAGAGVRQVVERNAAARGGAQAWQRVEAMAWTGYAENANAPGQRVPFLLEQKRPGKTRFEIVEPSGRKAVRAYDGAAGWKMRPTTTGAPEVTPYADDELRFARGNPVIDGPLMDYVARGAVLSVAGIDTIDGRRAYVVDAQLPSGGLHRVWVDAESFLELRHDRDYRDASGRRVTSTVRYRDYRSFEGLWMPVVIETGDDAGRPANRLVIERVALNPAIDDQAFAAPQAAPAHRGRVSVDTRSVLGPPAPAVARQRP